MKIIGTGLSGLVGSRIVELNPNIEFVEISLEKGIDLLDLSSLEQVFINNPDAPAVLHLAAFTDTNVAWSQNQDKSGSCYQVNVVGTQNIVDLCTTYNKHLIHMSTDYVFDGTKDGSYAEDDTSNPLDWYAETKLLAEKLVPEQFTIIRIASPYRAKFDTKIDLVRKIISKLSQGQTCNLFSDQFTTPTFIDDIALGLAKVFENPKLGVYHLVGSSSQSVFDMGKSIANIFDFNQSLVEPSSLVEYLKTPNARPYAPNLSLSNQKFIDTFGYVPRTLSEGLEEMKKQLEL
jgi:dTDP-4-dehydrorhamnose reductase